MRQPLAFGLVVAAIAVLASCRQIVGIEDSAPVEISTSAGGLQYGTGVCAACAQKFCLAQSTTCAKTSLCRGYEDCLGTCNGDLACRSRCTENHPIGLGSDSEPSAVGACLAANCESECNIACGGVVSYVTPAASAPGCAACIAPNCDDGRACGSSEDCDVYVRCLLACPTQDCKQACAKDHAAGYMLYTKFDAARATTSCQSACAYGANWTCVGHYVAPTMFAPSTTVTFVQVHDRSPPGNLLGGVQISACSADVTGANTCTPPVAGPVTTDGDGGARIEIRTVLPTSVSGQGYDGFLHAAAPGYADTYEFSGFPLSEPQLTYGPPFTPSLFLDTSPPVDAAATTGNLWGVAFDCLGTLAGGVRVATTNGSPVDDFGPLTLASGTGLGVNEKANFPAGPVVLTATPMGATKPVSTVSAEVYPGANTIVALFPNQ